MTESPPERRAPAGGPYLQVEMPEFFRLEFRLPNGGWMAEGSFPAKSFARLDDGSYVLSADGAHLWIRCIAHHDGYFEHIDGDGHGEVHDYRLIDITDS